MPAALVTGAGRGLGRAIARALHARGLDVHVTDVDGDAAAVVAAELGARARASALDVADAEACLTTARGTEDLEVWVNNAGVLTTGLSWEHPEEERRRLFEVNALGTINGTIAALDILRPRGHGHIVNVISLAGLVAPPAETLYGATKHAALGFSVGTLLDLRRSGVRDIHVSCLCPDGVWTPMLHTRVNDPEAWPSWTGVMMQPEEVAEKAVRLLDRPRAVYSVPRWRGGLVRVFAAAPDLFVRALPLVIADAHRKQRAWARRV